MYDLSFFTKFDLVAYAKGLISFDKMNEDAKEFSSYLIEDLNQDRTQENQLTYNSDDFKTFLVNMGA